MATCPGSTSSRNSIFEDFLQTWKEWQITILMILTMSLQLVLVMAGFFRKNLSNSMLHLTVWIAFIGLDALAAYALGLMLGGGCDTVFSLWAPILLFHLGSADSISAYSAADNEMWQRHSFKMSLEIVGAAYILSRAGNCKRFLATAVLFFLVGTFKYAERVYALWCGSAEQLVRGSRPIYKFMARDHHHIHRAAPSSGVGADQQPFPLIVSGEAYWYRSREQHLPLSEHPSLVTYEDIAKCRELKKEARYINDICLAFALFKIYRRRLTNLRIHHKDDDYEKVRRVLFPASQVSPVLRIINVIDSELSFIFDGSFTKGAAGRCFQGVGIATRLLSILFLFIGAVSLLASDAAAITCESTTTHVHMAGSMTILLTVISLVVECIQISKIVRSNWTRVWLACAYITEKRLEALHGDHHYRHSFHKFCKDALLKSFRYVGTPKGKHWDERIGQRSIVVDSMSAVCWHYFQRLEIDNIFKVKKTQSQIENMVSVDASNVHYQLIEKIAHKFADVTPGNLAQRRDRIARSVRFPFEAAEQRPPSGQEAILIGPEFSPASDSGLEEAVLNWHVATSVCEMDLHLSSHDIHSDSRQEEPVKMSIALSRYCLHLLVQRAKLTQADPDLCAPMYAKLKQQMKKVFMDHPQHMERALLQDYVPGAGDIEAEQDCGVSIDRGIRLGRAIMERWGSSSERWKHLMDVWVDILLYMAIAENAHPHADQLAKGGELLTHLWVLMGHLGFGQKSWITKPS